MYIYVYICICTYDKVYTCVQSGSVNFSCLQKLFIRFYVTYFFIDNYVFLFPYCYKLCYVLNFFSGLS